MRKILVLQVCKQLEFGRTEKTRQIFCKCLDRSRFEMFARGLRSGVLRAQAQDWLGIPLIIQPTELDALIKGFSIDIYHIYRRGDYVPSTLPSTVSPAVDPDRTGVLLAERMKLEAGFSSRMHLGTKVSIPFF